MGGVTKRPWSGLFSGYITSWSLSFLLHPSNPSMILTSMFELLKNHTSYVLSLYTCVWCYGMSVKQVRVTEETRSVHASVPRKTFTFTVLQSAGTGDSFHGRSHFAPSIITRVLESLHVAHPPYKSVWAVAIETLTYSNERGNVNLWL